MFILMSKPASKKDFIANAIVSIGKLATGDAKYHHCGLVLNNRVYEALVFGGVACRAINLAYEEDQIDLVKIPTTMFDLKAEKEAIFYLENLLGQFSGVYGLYKIPLQLFDGLASFVMRRRTFWFTKLFSVKSFPICSALVGYVLYKFGSTEEIKNAFEDWRGMAPDDVSDTLDTLLHKD